MKNIYDLSGRKSIFVLCREHRDKILDVWAKQCRRMFWIKQGDDIVSHRHNKETNEQINR